MIIQSGRLKRNRHNIVLLTQLISANASQFKPKSKINSRPRVYKLNVNKTRENLHFTFCTPKPIRDINIKQLTLFQLLFLVIYTQNKTYRAFYADNVYLMSLFVTAL